MLDWDDLRYFLAVARSGSTIAAAEGLKVNQSTVQRRLAALEEKIGRKLVERLPTGYRLTELGVELRPHAEAIETAVASFERRAAAADDGMTGVVRFTCPEGLAYRLISPLLDVFHARHPGLRVDLVMSDNYLDLAKGEADVAVRGGETRDSDLICRKLADNPWAVYASRAYVARAGRPARPDELDRHAVIHFEGPLAALHAAKWLRSVAPRAAVTAHCNSVLGMLLTAKSGVGLATLPVHIGDAEDDLVRVLEPTPELMSRVYILMHPALRNTPRVRAFFDFMVDEIGVFRPMLLGRK